MLRFALPLLLALGCSGDDDDPEGCTFEGRYELGLISRVEGCLNDAISIPAYGMDDVCFTTDNGVTPTGIIYELSIFCEPADPVVECSGRRSDSNGCVHDVYLRRVEP